MKIRITEVNEAAQRRRAAFTLIEMIGVLAVIAILASMLIPRVFEAINSARVNATAVACETIKTAAADHYGKYGQFNLLFGTNNVTGGDPTFINYDTKILMPEGLLDKPFSAKIAGADINPNSVIQLVQGGSGNGGAGYKLDGITNSTQSASFVLEAVMFGVSLADARDLNDRIDGTALGSGGALTDISGRVEYGTSSNNLYTVYVYLTHR